MLLQLALAYGPGGLSLRSAAGWAGATGLADLSDTALMNRLRGAGDWLGQLAGALLRQAASAATTGWPGRLRIVDGSVITRPGSTGTDWRLHATFDPSTGRFTDLALSDATGAESFSRAAVQAGDVVLGDRIYARPAGLRSVLDRGADFIVRVGCSSLRLVAPDGAPVAWAGLFATLGPGETAEQRVAVEPGGGKRRGLAVSQARLIVHRLSPSARRRAERQVRRKHSRCRAGGTLQPLTVASAGFLMLLCSLPEAVPAADILAAYRVRWQVELAFKRLKTLLGLHRLPAKSPALARSWLLAHLLLALPIDDTAQDLLASPPCAGRSRATLRLTLAPHPRAA